MLSRLFSSLPEEKFYQNSKMAKTSCKFLWNFLSKPCQTKLNIHTKYEPEKISLVYQILTTILSTIFLYLQHIIDIFQHPQTFVHYSNNCRTLEMILVLNEWLAIYRITCSLLLHRWPKSLSLMSAQCYNK